MEQDALEIRKSLDKPKILLVEDEIQNQKAIALNLKDLDIEIVNSFTGSEALDALRKHDFALAILDMKLPDTTGYDLAEKIRANKRYADIPLIFQTGVFTKELHIFKGYEYGAFSYITKPIDYRDLKRKVKYFAEADIKDRLLEKMQELLSKRVQQLERSKLELEKQHKKDIFNQRELEMMNKELEAFSYTVSHDLKSPLRAIKGFGNHLKKKYGGELNKEATTWLDHILSSVDHMDFMINNIFHYSKMSRSHLRLTKLNMNQLVKSVFEKTRAQSEKPIEFKLGKLPPYQGDEEMLKLVWQNLIENAIKFSSKKDKIRIEISGELQKDSCRYVIKDNGVGFEEDKTIKLFGIFQRLHSKNEFPGSGVGLATVKKIVEKHNGQIEGIGIPERGATFVITLPKNEIPDE